MKIPAALHPANHFHVQCLLLHAGLCADSGPCSQRGRQETYQLARALALARVPLEEGQLERCRRDKQTKRDCSNNMSTTTQARVRAVRWRTIAQLLHRTSRCLPPPSTQKCSDVLRNDPATPSKLSSLSAAEQATLSFTPPSRLVPLYAPRTLLPPFTPSSLYHDELTYDAAVHHAALLSQLLQPFGWVVSLTGAVRRGCPVAPCADYLLSLTETATREVEAVQEMQATDKTSLSQDKEIAEECTGDTSDRVGATAEVLWSSNSDVDKETNGLAGSAVGGSSHQSAPLSYKVTGSLRRNAFTVPMAAPLNKAGQQSSGLDLSAPVLHEAERDRKRRRQCSHDSAFASSDVVSPQVAYCTQRAIERLVQRGYIVAGQIPQLSPAYLSLRQPLHVSVRYDTRWPTQVPPVKCADPAVLARLQLHRVKLHFCPWHARATRDFFLTGPPAFTAHVTLQALARGFDLNVNGAFECVAAHDHHHHTAPQSGHEDDHRPADAASSDDNDDDAPAGLTVGTATQAVEDARKTIKESLEAESLLHCKDVTQVLLDSEESIFQIAGLPAIDPLLRGAYCQVHHLE